MAPHPHYDTPTKARVQGAIHYLKLKKIPYKAEEVFKALGVPRSSGFQMLIESLRQFHHRDHNETRGHKRKLTGDNV